MFALPVYGSYVSLRSRQSFYTAFTTIPHRLFFFCDFSPSLSVTVYVSDLLLLLSMPEWLQILNLTFCCPLCYCLQATLRLKAFKTGTSLHVGPKKGPSIHSPPEPACFYVLSTVITTSPLYSVWDYRCYLCKGVSRSGFILEVEIRALILWQSSQGSKTWR